ncbi:hypothetical protein [Streptomyces scabiei]|nr:hypothetical protein [Streptomyces scabiei]
MFKQPGADGVHDRATHTTHTTHTDRTTHTDGTAVTARHESR